MTIPELIQIRLHNQQLAGSSFKDPAKLVAYMGAIQSQDYAAAKWALGLRTPNSTEEKIEKLIAAGKILRTHVLRPTWHFVAPADLRWMLKLTAPRVHAVNASMYRKHGLDAELFKRSHNVLIKALKGNKQLTRTEIAAALQNAGISTDDLRLTLLVMQAELEGIICSGARQGKQFTYALLDERVSKSIDLKGEEAVSELAKRYFYSRGPATIADFVWWSGLTMADAKKGLAAIRSTLTSETISGNTYWMKTAAQELRTTSTHIHLLPAFDEYTIAYKDRSAALDAKHSKQTGNGIFNPQILLDGKIIGTWKRVIRKESVSIATALFTEISKSQQPLIDKEAQRYAGFFGLALS